MSTQVPLRCRCGLVRGVAANTSPKTGNRVVCYCDDCQAFAHFLKRSDVLDALGGSDIFQMAASNLRITEGADQLRCMRLSSKGLFRWYTECCKTPVGNTVAAQVPFVGVIQPFMDHEGDGRSRDEVLGRPVAFVYGRYAIGGLPAHAHKKAPLRFILRIIRTMGGWWLASRGKPSPFFDLETKAPRSPALVLSKTERDALRVKP